ncbi:MAG: hypothetical protein ACOY9Y_00570 [Bacillota bacterium]
MAQWLRFLGFVPETGFWHKVWQAFRRESLRIALWFASVGRSLSGWLTYLMGRGLCPRNRYLPLLKKNQEPEAAELARYSQRELKMAYRFFNEVTDPDLVDTAIHLISAYEKHYNYLLKEMRHAQNS